MDFVRKRVKESIKYFDDVVDTKTCSTAVKKVIFSFSMLFFVKKLVIYFCVFVSFNRPSKRAIMKALPPIFTGFFSLSFYPFKLLIH